MVSVKKKAVPEHKVIKNEDYVSDDDDDNSEEEEEECPECGIVFTDLSELASHYFNFHKEKKPGIASAAPPIPVRKYQVESIDKLASKPSQLNPVVKIKEEKVLKKPDFTPPATAPKNKPYSYVAQKLDSTLLQSKATCKPPFGQLPIKQEAIPASPPPPKSTTIQAPKPATLQAPKPATLQAPKPATLQAPKPARILAPKPVTLQAPKPVRIQAPNPATLQSPKPATLQAPKPATLQAPKPAKIQAHNQPTLQALKPVTIQAPKPATVQAPKLSTIQASKPPTIQAASKSQGVVRKTHEVKNSSSKKIQNNQHEEKLPMEFIIKNMFGPQINKENDDVMIIKETNLSTLENENEKERPKVKERNDELKTDVNGEELIDDPEDRGVVPGEDLGTYENMLARYIQEHDLPFIPRFRNRSDGNCWYEAIADQIDLHNIPNVPRDHVGLRKAICDALLILPQSNSWIKNLFGGKKKRFFNFVEKHRTDGEWTDSKGLVCQATALMLKRKIHIVGTANMNQSVCYTKLESVPEADQWKPLVVGYYQDKHYQSLESINFDEDVSEPALNDEKLNMKNDTPHLNENLDKLEKVGKVKVNEGKQNDEYTTKCHLKSSSDNNVEKSLKNNETLKHEDAINGTKPQGKIARDPIMSKPLRKQKSTVGKTARTPIAAKVPRKTVPSHIYDENKSKAVPSNTNEEIKIKTVSILTNDENKSKTGSSHANDENKSKTVSSHANEENKSKTVSSHINDANKSNTISSHTNYENISKTVANHTMDKTKSQSGNLLKAEKKEKLTKENSKLSNEPMKKQSKSSFIEPSNIVPVLDMAASTKKSVLMVKNKSNVDKVAEALDDSKVLEKNVDDSKVVPNTGKEKKKAVETTKKLISQLEEAKPETLNIAVKKPEKMNFKIARKNESTSKKVLTEQKESISEVVDKFNIELDGLKNKDKISKSKSTKKPLLSLTARRKLLNCAAVKIQSWYRHTHQGIVERRNFIRKRQAVIKIQAYWRSFMARRIITKTGAAVALQSRWRSLKSRRQFLNKRKAASLIQKVFRTTRTGKVERKDFLRKKRAAIAIQNKWRSWLSVINGPTFQLLPPDEHYINPETGEMQLMDDYIINYQTGEMEKSPVELPEYLNRISGFLDFTSLSNMAVKSWKRSELRMDILKKFQSQEPQCKSFSKCGYTEDAKVCKQTGLNNEKIFTISIKPPTIFRTKCKTIKTGSWKKPKLQKETFSGVLCDVSHWKKPFNVVHQSDEEFNDSDNNNDDSFEDSNNDQAVFNVMQDSLLDSPQCFSDIIPNKISELKKCEQIQFGNIRKARVDPKESWLESRIEIQRELVMNKAAITLQSHWLAFLARRRFANFKKSSIIIQKWFRNVKSRISSRETAQAERETYLKIKSCVITLQSRWRARIAGKRERTKYQSKKLAVITFQSHWRGLIARRRCLAIKAKRDAPKLLLFSTFHADSDSDEESTEVTNSSKRKEISSLETEESSEVTNSPNRKEISSLDTEESSEATNSSKRKEISSLDTEDSSEVTNSSKRKEISSGDTEESSEVTNSSKRKEISSLDADESSEVTNSSKRKEISSLDAKESSEVMKSSKRKEVSSLDTEESSEDANSSKRKEISSLDTEESSEVMKSSKRKEISSLEEANSLKRKEISSLNTEETPHKKKIRISKSEKAEIDFENKDSFDGPEGSVENYQTIKHTEALQMKKAVGNNLKHTETLEMKKAVGNDESKNPVRRSSRRRTTTQ